jgi:hypothetical protein
MPMTPEEARISFLLGDRQGYPAVGMSRKTPGVAFAALSPDYADLLLRSSRDVIVLAAQRARYRFDGVMVERVVSSVRPATGWRPDWTATYDEGPRDPASTHEWTDRDEADLQILRDM